MHEVHAQSQQFFGQVLTEEHVQSLYKAVTKKNGDYPRHLRAKVNTAGANRTRYWDASKARMDPPADHTGLTFSARVVLRAIWIAGEAWGLVADVTDLLLQDESVVECPF